MTPAAVTRALLSALGEDVVLSGGGHTATVRGYLTERPVEVDFGVTLAGTKPACECLTAEVDWLHAGYTLTARGKVFSIAEAPRANPDTGSTVLMLREGS